MQEKITDKVETVLNTFKQELDLKLVAARIAEEEKVKFCSIPIAHVVKRFSEKGEESTCIICLDALKDTLLQPCRHLCVCEGCAKALKVCPVCRAKISKTEKVFV